MSEMIERVAAAIYPDWFCPHAAALENYEGQADNYREMARKKARAAIEAMRLTDADWPDNIRYSDDIEAFNDTIDMAVGKALFPSGDRRARA